MPENEYQGVAPAKIPADVDQADKIVFGLTARQAGFLTVTAAGLWLLFQGSRPLVPALVFLPAAALVLLAVAVAVAATRDGLSLDRLGIAALRHAASPKRQVLAPEGIGEAPAFLTEAMSGDRGGVAAHASPVHEIDSGGFVDLGKDGATGLASCSTVNFALRTSTEQEVLLGGFARWLNSLTGPVQISSRSHPVDLSARIQVLRRDAGGLPHPQLEAAALEHADFMAGLAERGGLLTRQILLAFHEDGPEPGARLARRAGDAVAQLSACDISVQPLNHADASAALASAFRPTP